MEARNLKKLNGFFCFIVFLGLVFAACGDPQADTEYVGDPLATIKGWVQVQEQIEVSHARVSLVWYVTAGQDYFSFGGAPVEGEFPAQFQIDLVEPPPQNAFNDFTENGRKPSESHVGIAYLIVYDDKNGNGLLDYTEEQEDSPDVPLGASQDNVVVYLVEDVKPDTFSAEIVGGTLRAGYHLMAVEYVDEEEFMSCFNGCVDRFCTEVGGEPVCDDEAISQCQEDCGRGFDQLFEAPDGFETEIPITLTSDPSDIELPNFS